MATRWVMPRGIACHDGGAPALLTWMMRLRLHVVTLPVPDCVHVR